MHLATPERNCFDQARPQPVQGSKIAHDLVILAGWSLQLMGIAMAYLYVEILLQFDSDLQPI